MTPERGDRIGVWVIEAALGRGGMGSVYRCHHVETERLQAAVKVLGPTLRQNTEAQRRFIREAEILGALNHPHIVRVRGLRMDMDPPFIEMDFVAGVSFEALIDKGPTPLDEVLPWMIQLADALQYLHGRGVRHRDVKPGNVLVTPDHNVVLVDFGLAMDADLHRLTQDGLSFGTVSYAPPEWMDPERLDPVQWDLYAVGVIFYELLTGKTAFPLSGQGPTRKQLLQVAMKKQKAPPLDPGAGFPSGVRTVIARLTSKDIASRPATAADLLADLRALQAGDALAEVPRQVPWGAVLALGGVFLVGALGGWWGLQGRVEPPPEAPPMVLDPEVAPPQLASLEVSGIEGSEVRVAGVSAVLGTAPLTLSDVPIGPHELTWAFGEDCDACFDGPCAKHCGHGVVAVDVGADSAPIVLPERPMVSVEVSMPQLEKPRSGVFRKKPWPVWATVDGRALSSRSHWEVAGEVSAGAHHLVVSVGECEAAEIGCQPGRCSPKCSSVRRELTVPWDMELLRVQVDLPPPEK